MRPLQELATQIGETLLAQGHLLALAESCTGGLAAASITDLAGSSAWFDSSVVVYSNQAKQDLLKVPVETLAQYGAVSEPVATSHASMRPLPLQSAIVPAAISQESSRPLLSQSRVALPAMSQASMRPFASQSIATPLANSQVSSTPLPSQSSGQVSSRTLPGSLYQVPTMSVPRLPQNTLRPIDG